ALEALADDAATQVVLLVSKPASPAVAAAVLNAAVATRKPVVACLLGYVGKTPDGVGAASTLEEAAVVAIGLAGREVGAVARPPVAAGSARGAVRGLYSGGTLGGGARGVGAGSGRAAVRGRYAAGTLCDAARRIVAGAQHQFTDFGAEEFTRGRPHPI